MAVDLFTPLTKEDRRLAKRKAIQEAERERALQLQRQQWVFNRLRLVDAAARYPFVVGREVTDIARLLARRLYEDILSLPEGFRRLVLAPNSNKDELGGHLIEYDPQATGVRSSSILSRKHPFGIIAIFPVHEGVAGTLTNIRGVYAEKLKTSVSSFPRDSPRLRSVLPASSSDPLDADRWQAYLPMHSRVGLYRKNGNLYLIIVTHAGHDLAEAADDILAEGDMTMEKFVKDSRVHRLQAVVVRNAKRVAARIITDLDRSVKIDNDPYTRLIDDLSYYELAEPVHVMKLNHMHFDARANSVRAYVDATCHSAVLHGRGEYAVWCGRTHDYFVTPLSVDSDASAVLPLKTDKLLADERTHVSEEEHEVIGAHIQYATPRSEAVGAFIKYRTPQAGSVAYKHVSSVHI